MKKYLFVLGRDPLLSIAEIFVFLKSRNISFRLTAKENDAVLIESDLNPEIIEKLGGTVKIAEMFFEGNSLKEIEEQVNKKELIEWMNQKFSYAISFFGKELEETTKAEEFFKKKFKETKKKALYKKHKGKKFGSSPTQVHSLNLIREESDFVFFNSGKIFFGKTVSCFNPKEMKERDIGRPAQNKLSSVSLRLARILINLTGVKENQTLLDPFCGIASVSQEAMFKGINTIGIELKEETAGMARKNLEWFEKKYKTGKTWKIIQGDSAYIKETLQGKGFDAVASEPYLGPLLKRNPREYEAKKIISELEELYSAFFRKLAMIVKKQGIVIILPEIECSNGKKIGLSEKVFSKNFRIVNPVPEMQIFPYYYMEKESIITRKIYLLEKF